MEKHLFIPLFNLSLPNDETEELDLGFGHSISKILPSQKDTLKNNKELTARYSRKIDQLTAGIEWVPTPDHPVRSVTQKDAIKASLFVCFVFRIVTGIQIDFPFFLHAPSVVTQTLTKMS